MATKNTALRNKMADDFGALFNSGSLEILTSADAVLVSFDLEATAFGAATTGKISAAGTPITATAGASGTAAKASLKSSDGTTYLLTDLTVGTSGANVIIDNTSIENGQTVNLNQFDWTESAGIA